VERQRCVNVSDRRHYFPFGPEGPRCRGANVAGPFPVFGAYGAIQFLVERLAFDPPADSLNNSPDAISLESQHPRTLGTRERCPGEMGDHR
jgi:hypothetical protein